MPTPGASAPLCVPVREGAANSIVRARPVGLQNAATIFEVSDGNRTKASAFERWERERGTSVHPTYDADHWRRLAEGARATAERMSDHEARREMHIIALAYERLAEHAERTAGRRAARRSG
jgi:hypothetical protein